MAVVLSHCNPPAIVYLEVEKSLPAVVYRADALDPFHAPHVRVTIDSLLITERINGESHQVEFWAQDGDLFPVHPSRSRHFGRLIGFVRATLLPAIRSASHISAHGRLSLLASAQRFLDDPELDED